MTLIKQHDENSEYKISGSGVTKFNPEQSKILETATAKIDNHWLDFVNLGFEEYLEDSRIPVMVTFPSIVEIWNPPRRCREKRFHH